MSQQDCWIRIRRMVRRRLRISETAAKEEAARPNTSARMLDYHAGCIGVCQCLLDDISSRVDPPKVKAKP